MTSAFSRRQFLQTSAAAAIVSATAPGTALAEDAAAAAPGVEPKRYQDGLSPWPLSMNTSTIRPASLAEKIEATASTGWDAIELWINELEEYEQSGGDLKALGKELLDRGLFVPNVIGLWDCMPATQEAWDASLEKTRERMRMSAAVGSRHVAAIPAPDRADFDLKWGADRYRDLLRIGRDEFGLTVAFEFVGFLKGVHRLGQAAAIALDADDPAACLVMDTFHLYRGGSGFGGVKHLQGSFIANFHWNDVPADLERETAGDEHRIYPGDGCLPLVQCMRDLKAIGFTRTISLEMFNREHWKMDPKVVAETGIRKIRENLAAAGV